MNINYQLNEHATTIQDDNRAMNRIDKCASVGIYSNLKGKERVS